MQRHNSWDDRCASGGFISHRPKSCYQSILVITGVMITSLGWWETCRKLAGDSGRWFFLLPLIGEFFPINVFFIHPTDKHQRSSAPSDFVQAELSSSKLREEDVRPARFWTMGDSRYRGGSKKPGFSTKANHALGTSLIFFYTPMLSPCYPHVILMLT